MKLNEAKINFPCGVIEPKAREKFADFFGLNYGIRMKYSPAAGALGSITYRIRVKIFACGADMCRRRKKLRILAKLVL